MFQFKAGSTGKTVYVKLVDSATFLGKTGLLFSDLTIQYILAVAAAVAVTEATLASASAAWSSGGFKEVDATNSPGLYRFDVPDAALATGPFVILTFKASGTKDEALVVQLVAYDPYDGASLGLSRLDVALSTVAAYIDTEVAAILAAVDTEVAAIKAKTDNLPSDPADASDIAALFAAVPAAVLAAATAAPIKADLMKINSVALTGDGSTTPFGP